MPCRTIRTSTGVPGENVRHAARGEPRTEDVLLFEGELFKIGRFNSPPDAPDFATAGPIVGPVFVFPRTSVWIQHEGRPRFVGDVHSVTLYNTGQPYRRAAIAAEGDVCDWFRIREEVAAEVVAEIYREECVPAEPFRDPRVNASPGVCLAERTLFRQIISAPQPDPLAVEETALALLCRLLRDARGAPAGRSTSGRASRDLVEASRAALGRRTTRRPSLSTLANEAGCSPFHLCRTFSRETGLTLSAYRDRLRLGVAMDLVLDGGCDITDAALHAGYSSHSHFTFAFRRAFGVTPSQARRWSRRAVVDLRRDLRS